MDGPIFTYIGKTVLAGGAAYRDAWDIKAPGVFFFYALASWLGQAPLSVHLLEALWQSGTAVTVGLLAARRFESGRAGLLGGLIYLGLLYSQEGGWLGQADGLISLPLALAVWFALLAQERDALRNWFLAAFFTGIAAVFKMPLGLLGIAFLWMAWRTGPRSAGEPFRRLAALAAGVAAPLLACLGYFHALGATRDLINTVFVIGPRYASLVWRHPDLRFLVSALLDPRHIPLYIAGVLAGASARNPAPGNERQRACLVLVAAWAATSLIVLVWHGAFLGYQFQELFAPLAVLSGGAVEAFAHNDPPRPLARKVLMAIAGVGAVTVATCVILNVTESLETVRAGNETEELASFIRARTTPKDSIYVWGRHAALYLSAGRRPASKFLNSVVLTEPWRELGLRPEFLQELQRDPPAYIVVESEGASLSSSSNLPQMRQLDFEREAEKFTALRQLLKQSYLEERRTKDWVLYRKK